MKDSVNQSAAVGAATNAFLNWPPAQALPANRNVEISFRGLMGFCYRSSGESSRACEIGFHPGDGRHRLEVEIYDETRTKIYPEGGLPANIVTMRFGIENKPAGVKFLKLGPDPFIRNDLPAEDFRWMLDLEGDDFYPEKYDKKKVFSSKLFITHGTFYTADKTESEFDRVSIVLGVGAFEPKSLGPVVWESAATFELAPSEFAFLEINGQKVKRLPGTLGKKYEVNFYNGCEELSKPCQWSPGSVLESWRSDFHFHRDVLSLPLLRARYGLLFVSSSGADVSVKEESKFGTDRAPCMGAGFGQTDGFG